MKILICANFNKKKTHDVVPLVVEKMTEFGIEPLFDETRLEECDALVSVGGDGTILRWGKVAASVGKPLLGINTGTLGFMATLEVQELDLLSRLASGQYRISSRMMLDVNVAGQTYHALNDVVLHRKPSAKLPTFTVLCSDIEVSNIRADGIIFSTATGSTAYALSAGGPIIEPELECVEFTPLCAHTLFGRPMIFTGENVITVRCNKLTDDDVLLSVDGDDAVVTQGCADILIQKSSVKLDLIDIGKNSFYSAVDSKLMKPMK